MSVTCLNVGNQFLHCAVTWLSSGLACLITFAYAMNDAKDRTVLWDFLKTQATSIDGPWAILGDFNTTLSIMKG